jgi:hypothetical protein
MSYELIQAEADRLGLPERHRDDLIVHDFASLDEAPPRTPYLWCVYDWGTHLVLDCTDLHTRWRSHHKMWLDIWRMGQEPNATHRYYHFDGHALRAVTAERRFLRILDELNVRDSYPRPTEEA